MKPLQGFLIAGVVLLLLVPTTVLAAGPQEGKVIVGGTYSLLSGEVLEGDLLVIGGVADLDPGSRVGGDVVLVGGLITADGEVDGDLVTVGGIANLGATALVRGDLVGVGAAISRAEGSRVEGLVSEGPWEGGLLRFGPGMQVMLPPIGTHWATPGMGWGFGWADPTALAGWSLLRALLMAGLAAVIVVLWPERAARAARAVVEQPVAAGGVGLLTGILSVAVIVGLMITICLIPFGAIAGLLLAAALAFGWASLGLALGWRMSQTFRLDWQPTAQAAVGTLLVSLAASLFGLIPCVGLAVPTVLGLIGLGAVTQTRFGGQDSWGATSAPVVDA